MKYAAIDIGTNSMRLLISEYKDGKFLKRDKFINTTRIGKNVDNEGIISKDAIEKNIDALCKFYNQAKESDCKDIYIIGTSALRDSKNKNEFVKKAKDKLDANVDIIDGDMEANMGFMGVLSGMEDKKEDILVIDIGGGSTEFIVGNEEGIKFCKSENVGAVRMSEKFLKKDPIDEVQYQQMKDYIHETISNTLNIINEFDIKKIIGIGGTITTLASMHLKLEEYDMQKTHNLNLDILDLKRQIDLLMPLSKEEKRNIIGLQPKRADIISAGFAILEIILNNFYIDSLYVSEYDNLEGLIYFNYTK